MSSFHLTVHSAVELRNGEMYRGRLVEAEDNMSCQLSGIVLTGKDGKVTSLEQVCVSPAPVACLSYLSLPLAVHVLHSMLNPFVSQLLAGQPRPLHDSAGHAQARTHVQPHRPQARFARAAVHKPSEKLACVGAFLFRALRVHHMLALFVHAPQTRLRILLLYFLFWRALTVWHQVFFAARVLASTAAVAAGAGVACGVVESACDVNCCCAD